MIGGILSKRLDKKEPQMMAIPNLAKEFDEDEHEYLRPLLDSAPKEEAKEAGPPVSKGPVRIVIRSSAGASESR